MTIKITGNVHLSSAIENYVNDKIKNDLSKSIPADNTDFTVSFSKNGRNIKVLLTAKENISRGLVIKAQEEDLDAYTAFDMAMLKIIKSLRKYKEKVNSYKKKIVSLKEQEIDLPFIVADRNIITQKDEEETPKFEVVETKKTEIEELTVDEAVMKMELLGLYGFAFLNKENNKLNFIYKRPDGNIAWVNPSEFTKK